VASYDLDAIGWLLFERLAKDAAEAELGVPASAWVGDADAVAEARWPGGLPALGLDGPVTLRMIHARPHDEPAVELRRRAREAGPRPRRPVVLLTNLEEERVASTAARRVLGRAWLSEALERSAALRRAHPALLARRSPPVPTPPRGRFDRGAADALADVFVEVHPHARALGVLVRHRFAVLTGPPEMGKTAIARMIGLAAAADGWEVHECTDPAQVAAAFDPGAAQLFVADDAFGSTEYRPEAAERWATHMERLLRRLDDRHWLVWTSRPAPLHAALARLRRERGAERFPRPGEVLVDASALDRAERALILLRHARAAGVGGTPVARVVRALGDAIVEDPHFTPERIRRFATGRLARIDSDPSSLASVRALVAAELREPTTAMARSLDALDAEHRDVLVALLDCPPGGAHERDLAAAVRRHADAGLAHAPQAVVDRLADHFLRAHDGHVGWVHPSWRDLVIERVASRPAERRRFLERCGLDGLLLALSVGGGAAGERRLPLLAADEDWDVAGARAIAVMAELDEHDAIRLLLAVAAAWDAGAAVGELRALGRALLEALRRRWDRDRTTPGVGVLAAFLELAGRLGPAGAPDAVTRAWFALLPPAEGPLTDEDLQAADDWLWLVEVLEGTDGRLLDDLGFPGSCVERLQTVLAAVDAPGDGASPARAGLAAGVRARLARLGLAPGPATAPDDDPQPPDPSPWTPPPAEAQAAARPPTTVDRILADL
jgi:hypothetical protein